jgi:hypothetical protein
MTHTTTILAPVSAGELIDKITILEIKTARITDSGKLANVQRELSLLTKVRNESLPETDELAHATAELKSVNEQLWMIEDEIRLCERQQDFGPRFIELARAVYKTNDRRAAIKHRINEQSGSALSEEKSYCE